MRYNLDRAMTHAGSFHADDVFSAGLLKLLNPDIQIQRVMLVPKDYDGLVFDIGLGKFDHHQADAEVRENEIPYAAFGLLWREFGKHFLDEEGVQKIDESFIQDLDLSDNTGSFNELARMIGDFNTTWEENSEEQNERFEKMAEWAKEILARKIEVCASRLKAEKFVRENMKNTKGQILFLERALPWKGAVKESPFVYVIYPSNRGGYGIQAVPDDEDSSLLKKPFPKEWWGRTEEELVNLTGIRSFHFCHKSGFLCSAQTLEDAWKVADLALKNE